MVDSTTWDCLSDSTEDVWAHYICLTTSFSATMGKAKTNNIPIQDFFNCIPERKKNIY